MDIGSTNLQIASCNLKSLILPGGGPNSCSSMKCQFGAKCVHKAGIPQCDCESCSDEDFAPVKVCGTDGQTYGSECQLKTFACRLQRDIAVDYEGPCKRKCRRGLDARWGSLILGSRDLH
jgi:coxsackievirus/adenovirus receptor